jgi:hypothetical protein
LKVEFLLSASHVVRSRSPQRARRGSVAGQDLDRSRKPPQRSAIIRDTSLNDLPKVTEIPALAMDPLTQTKLHGDGLADVVDVVAIEMVSGPKSSKPTLVVEFLKVHTNASDSRGPKGKTLNHAIS